jgi:tetratricopeptide (TPR) repeat protein
MNQEDSTAPGKTPDQIRLSSEEVDRLFRTGEDYRVLAEKPGGEGLFQEAIEHYRKAILIGGEGNRAVAQALSQCAYCLQETGQIHEALKCYEKLVVLCPADQEAWYSRGFVEDEIGSSELENSGSDQLSFTAVKYFNSAVHSFAEALNLKPEDKKCLVMLGNVHMSLRNFENSIHYYHKALEVEPECTMTHYNIAHVHHSMACDHETTDPDFVLPNMEKARNYFKEAIRLNPDYVDAYFNIGICYQDMALEYATQQNRTKRSECLRCALNAYNTVISQGDGDTRDDALDAVKQIELDLGVPSPHS